MNQVIHEFNKSKKEGDKGEAILDKYFSQDNIILDVPFEMQKKGIDRVFYHKKHDFVESVEYKTDSRAADTGNFFIEIWSNKEAKKKGWVYTSKTDTFMFYIPSKDICYEVEACVLRAEIKADEKSYKVGSALNRIPNDGGFYRSEGLLVPVETIKRICDEVYEGVSTDVQ